VEHLASLLRTTKLSQKQPKIIEGWGILGIGEQRTLVSLLGRCGTTLSLVCPAQINPGLDIVRIEADGGFEQRTRLVITPQARVQSSEVVVAPR